MSGRKEPTNVLRLIGRGVIRAVTGYPPAGTRQPGVGDGRTTTNRKVKLDKQAKHKGKHTGK